jgi:hypothetical protein
VSKPIIVEASQNIADVERLLIQLDERRESTDLILPTQLKNWQAGGAAALIQFIITWAKRHPAGRLITHIQETLKALDQLSRLADEDHGLVSLVMAKDVVLRSGSESVRASAYEAAKSRIARMDLGIDTARQGPQLFFLCADHTTKAHLGVFYGQTDTPGKPVRSRRDFSSFARTCLLSIAAPGSPQSRLLDTTFSQLGLILHELFQNTDEWARTDWKGLRIPRSVRGIRFELTARTASALAQTVRGSVPLEEYVAHDAHRLASHRQHLLEVSVFDSGPGLAQRWLASAIPEGYAIESEYEAALACLKKHATTSDVSHRGLGLHRVMQTMNAGRGFLRIRSGRLSLFRDFIRDPYETSGISLCDWATGEQGRPSPAPPSEGTLFTILLPLGPREGDQ